MNKIDYEDDNMKQQVEEIDGEYTKMRTIHQEHMKFIIGVLSK